MIVQNIWQNNNEISEIKISKLKRFNFNILLANSIITILFIIFLSLFLYFKWCIQPYPERTLISEMTPRMIEDGQARSLIIIVSFGFLAIFSGLADFIICSIVIYWYFANHIYYFKHDSWLNNPYVKWIFRILFAIIYYGLSVFLVTYFWFVYLKEYKDKFNNNNLLIGTNYTKSTKVVRIFWIIFFICLPILGIGIYVIYLFLPMNLNTRVPNENIKKYLKLSNNHQNVLFLSFDRSNTITWNLLMYAEHLLNKENSFMSLFPEFTSYLNTFTNASVTNISNPLLYGGPYFSQFLKTSSLNNVTSLTPNNDLTVNQWYYYSILSMLKSYLNNGFNDLGLCSIPYYGDKIYEWQFGDMYQLEEDLLKKDNVKITSMDFATLCKDIDYKIYNYQGSYKFCDLVAFDHLKDKFYFDTSTGGGI